MDLNYVEFTRHSPVDSVIVTKIMSEEISRDKDFFYKYNALYVTLEKLRTFPQKTQKFSNVKPKIFP